MPMKLATKRLLLLCLIPLALALATVMYLFNIAFITYVFPWLLIAGAIVNIWIFGRRFLKRRSATQFPARS